eukprot:m.1579685 g.1579685  ORF g.1579685 m.1579685 type:complete len:54 (-) comp25315_c0_seq10:742-903(-)
MGVGTTFTSLLHHATIIRVSLSMCDELKDHKHFAPVCTTLIVYAVSLLDAVSL